LDQIIGQASDSGDLYEINIPARLKRCGIETKLIISESTPQDVHDKTRQALQSALAKREGVTQRNISHLLKLAYLAPDIMTAIVKGQIPCPRLYPANARYLSLLLWLGDFLRVQGRVS